NRFVPNAHGSQSACDDAAIDPVAIADEVARSLIPGKRLGDLARDPFRRRVGCDVDPDEISAINPYNHEAIQKFEANGRDHQQIPWRQCPGRGSAERSSTPDWAVDAT